MKWFFPTNDARRVKTVVARNKKWLLLAVFTSFLAVAAFSIISPNTSFAADPKVTDNNLLNIGNRCHDLHSITFSFGGDSARCHDGDGSNGWQEIVADDLGCSDSMFYQHENPIDDDDGSVTETLWYTKQGDYKDCWIKAGQMLDNLQGKDCAKTKKDSDNYKTCEGYQQKLAGALGCNSDMFVSAGDDKWTINKADVTKCQGRINQVGDVKIRVIGENGKPIYNPDPIKSDTVATTNPNDGGNGDDDGELGCDASGGPLSWVICPVISLMTKAISATDSLITDQMSVKTESIFCTNASGSDDSCQAYYSAWSTFRNIALGLLVIAGLIIVIAQAVGMEILDAYTIRKTLPRLLVAAIGITLSWTLMNFAITLSNNLGYGIRDLIVAPFNHLTSTIDVNLFDGSLFDKLIGTGETLAIAGAGITAWIAFGGVGVTLSYIATAGLAVLIAILVLIIRQIVIIMLVLLSPIALIAYVLPNTQRIFRLWWESFTKALLMFPLIAAFIATGRVVAAISLQSGGVVNGIIGFVAYFGPYFLIPLTFRLSGGIMNGVGGFIQQRSQGLSQALGGYRTGQRQQRVQRARTEGLYRNNFGKFKLRPGGKQRSLGKGLNAVGFWGLNADEMIPMKLGTTNLGKALPGGKRGIPGFRRGGQELMSEIERAKRDQTLQGAQDLDIGYKSGRLMAGQFQYYNKSLSTEKQAELDNAFGIKDPETGKFTGWRAPDNWGERMQVAEIFDTAEGAGGMEAREAAGELKATASEFEKYTKSPETNRVDGRLLGLVSAAKAGRLEVGDVVKNHNDILAQGPEHQSQALRETTILQDALTPKRVSAARGHAISYDEDGTAHNVYDMPTSAKAQTSLMRINTQEIAAGKSEDVDALRETLVAGASGVKMKLNHVSGKVEPDIDPNTGGVMIKDPASVEGQRVQEVRNRIKTLAMYNSGDSDVGAKVRDIWVNRLGLDEGELDWGSRGHTGDIRDLEAAGVVGGPAAGAGTPGDGTGGQGPQPGGTP